MWVDLVFNRLRRDAQGVLDREWSAGSVRNDANTVDSEERRTAVFLVVDLFLDRQESVLREKGSGHADFAFDQLVLEPFENRVAD